MTNITVLYTPAFFIAALSAAFVAWTAWRRRPAPGASGLALMSMGTCIWSLAYLLQWTLTNHEPSLLFYVLRQIGIIGGASGSLILTLQFTRQTNRVGRKTYLVLSLMGIATIISILTDPLFGLYFGSALPKMHLPKAGPLYTISSAYLYGLMLLSLGLLIKHYWQGGRLARPQTSILLFAFSFPTAVMALNSFGVQVLPYINSGSLALAVTGPLVAYGLFRFGLLRYVPFARDLLVENLPDGVIVVDPEMRILDMNPAARNMAGIQSVSLGQPLVEVMPQLLSAGVLAVNSMSNETSKFELSLDGPQIRTIEVSSTAVRETIGQRVGVLITLRDITERRRMLRDLEDRTADLAATLERSSLVLATISEGVLLVDKECRILRSNLAAERILDAPFQSSENLLLEDIAPEIPAEKLAKQARESANPITHLLSLADGRSIALEAIPLTQAISHSAQVLFIIRDETARIAANRMQRDFIGNISHELRTPLTGLLLLADNLPIAMREDPDKVEHFIEHLGSEVDRMVKMADELLTLVRIEDVAQNTTLILTDIDLSGIVSEAVKVARPLAQAKEQHLELKVLEELPILGDENSLFALVGSLLENAIRYSNPGGAVTVTAQSDTDEDGSKWAVITVADNGIGIPPEHQERIFERFYRVDKARSRATGGGTGLGLSIVQHAVEQHHGTVEVDSKLEVGSVFTVRIPLER